MKFTDHLKGGLFWGEDVGVWRCGCVSVVGCACAGIWVSVGVCVGGGACTCWSGGCRTQVGTQGCAPTTSCGWSSKVAFHFPWAWPCCCHTASEAQSPRGAAPAIHSP